MINRILIVGIGSIGERHLRIARDLFPIADIRVLRHKTCSKPPNHSDGCFSNIKKACGFFPEIAIISTPSPFHIHIAMNLVSIGCHLLIEKPLATNTNGVSDLIDAAYKNNVIIQVGYNLRFHTSLIQFRKLIHEGKIGRVLSVRAEVGQYLPLWRPGSDYRSGVSARKDLGGGVLLELSHELDYLRWIFGEAILLGAVLGNQSDLELDVEDSAFVTLQFSSNNSQPGPIASLCMDFIRHDTTRTCVAIGSEGTLKWDAVDGVVEYWQPGASKWTTIFRHPTQRDDTYRSEWQHFLDCIENKTSPLVTADDGLAVIKMIEAARISNESKGKYIRIRHGQ